MIHHPHDSLFKSAFGKKVVTKDFLRHRLPPEILARIDINTLERQDTSFVNEQLKAYHADLVFSVNTTEGDGYLFFLLEHQTKADPLMPLRLLEYNVSIMRHDVEQQIKGKKENQETPIKLPVIMNFVVFTGKAYNYPTRLLDAFRTPALVYKMFEEPFLIHLSQEKESTLMRDGKGALAEILLREGRRKGFCKFLAGKPDLGAFLNKIRAQSLLL